MTDRLYRSRSDRVISGVAGGLAERLDADPSIVRVVWVIVAVLSGGMLALVYLVMMVVVPKAPFDAPRRMGGVDPWSSPAATGIRPPNRTEASSGDDATVPPADADETSTFASVDPGANAPPEAGTWLAPDGHRVSRADPGTWGQQHEPRHDRGGGLVLGLILILIGAFFLIREYLPEVDLNATWPIIAVAAGVLLVVLSLIPDRSRG
jgi:phage shock protein C